MDLAPAQNDSLTAQALAHLSTATGGQFTQHQSSHWQSKWADFQKQPECPYALTEATKWQCINRPPHSAVSFSGRLIGGCVDTLMHTAGTPFGNVASFIRRHHEDGVILYLENSGLSPEDWVRALHSMRWHGWLTGLNGVLIGRSAAPDTTLAESLRYADAVRSTLADLPCPVLTDVDIGHLPPQMLLLNGAMAQVRWSFDEGGLITQTLV